MSKLGIDIAPLIDLNRNPEEISKEINDAVYDAYEKDGRKPRLIDQQYMIGLHQYLGVNVSKQMLTMLSDYFKDFYHLSPEPYPSAKRLLELLHKSGRGIILHSHAQDDWTRIKVNLLEELTGISLPYFATPLNSVKDSNSWLNAFGLLNTPIENALVIGDNFEADILPPIKVGSKHAIWVNRYNYPLPQNSDITSEVELMTVQNLSDLIDNISMRI